MAISAASTRIHQAVMGLSGVTAHQHRFGGTEYHLGKRELGHIHGDRLVDLPFPTRVRDELISSGRAEPHHLLAESGWVSLYLRQEADIERAIELFRYSYELAQQKWQPEQANEQ